MLKEQCDHATWHLLVISSEVWSAWSRVGAQDLRDLLNYPATSVSASHSQASYWRTLYQKQSK